uniref:Leucine-rich repeat receptor-like serine/threonine-protein kinase BAM1 n=1 Tax=Nicotiana sylvestris TaxID=4096 RepID=A0A1U7WGG1_NICSY|nr:PREDICTED: leucine-rich repeat receptor-like serine/threonine-protein kinase BAM1 [Nicotiana sylvestris]
MKFSDLIILSLSSNKFYGELPPEICHLKDLQIVNLANNSFFGTIPRCISNLTAMVAEDKLGEADIEYGQYFGEIVRESTMVTTKRNIYQYDKTLASVTSMDMSNNNLSGDIPISFTSLIGLRIYNFSKNHLTGRIPYGIGDMKVLESLDLSENQLSGKILVSTQLQSFSSSSFQGNELCGLPLFANCSLGGQNLDGDTEKDESDEDELDWFYIAMSIGFGLSFWGLHQTDSKCVPEEMLTMKKARESVEQQCKRNSSSNRQIAVGQFEQKTQCKRQNGRMTAMTSSIETEIQTIQFQENQPMQTKLTHLADT